MVNSARRLKKIEFSILVFLTLVVAVIFADGRLDLWAGRLFFHPEVPENRWLEDGLPLWQFFYHAAPWITGVILLPGLAVLVANAYWKKLEQYRMQAVFAFVVVALGPGLVINTILKPYWGRPRPREVLELGGQHQFKRYYQVDFAAQGKSFPCGHCSVGFSFIIAYWCWRKKSMPLALGGVLGSFGFGSLMGIGRMAAGGHFLSDVAWAGLITYWLAYFSYHHLLALDENAEGRSMLQKFSLMKLSPQLKFLVFSLFSLLTVLVLLLASPFNAENIRPFALTDKDLVLLIPQSQIELVGLPANDQWNMKIEGHAKGFGFPGATVKLQCESVQAITRCEFVKKGIFTDFESTVRLALRFEDFKSILIKNEKGEVLAPEHLPQHVQIENRP